ncbi:NAD(P)-binding domain-containing protein [Variovorax sp. NFACC27]|uniref:NAD(P)-dependent oxidoreductase n=1 Tax=unclassified Variovorax TaxID=663243 RepID=UPI00089C5BD4|nr:3-hydroxyisobutyrate dehydrogenase [Variovorax sp. NFACC28]SEG59237.1 3-hydroxyisobutyrate dehydrogenase [Variovorax sp. NFACC29]SFC58539.1 3-hydroxyisobutyrate dehydrogenase [Variovorax sp. NFACC26]SFG66553.1 3-hydroxyisobutyrate dehydrogenase [Variovorax sp. NFACC27]
MSSKSNDIKEVSVLGLGAMGEAIARLYLDQGYKVTVWNRTAGKADALVAKGAVLARSASEAVRAARVVVMCVYDYRAADAIFALDGVAAAMDGRLLVQLTTGSPQDARDAQAWARKQGAAYLEGAIQAAPDQMGQPDTPLLVSGARPVFDEAEPWLKALAGGIVYLGGAASAAAAMDLATLSTIYGTMLGFIHGARIAEHEGFDVAEYGRIVAGIMPTFAGFLQHEGSVIQSGDFAISQSPMRISVEATRRILQSAQDSGIDTGFPAFAAGIFQRADAAGLGGEELAALIKLLRAKQTSA